MPLEYILPIKYYSMWETHVVVFSDFADKNIQSYNFDGITKKMHLVIGLNI
jgi:hypothetical protein